MFRSHLAQQKLSRPVVTFKKQIQYLNTVACWWWLPLILRLGLVALLDLGFALYYRYFCQYQEPAADQVNRLVQDYNQKNSLLPTLALSALGSRVAIITGGNSGIGLETARALAQAKFLVVLACRDRKKAKAAINLIHQEIPEANILFLHLDLAQIESIRRFVRQFARIYDRVDVLINNAGVMCTPQLTTTVDSFELQYQVNYLGPYLLTRLLLPLLTRKSDAAPYSIVINVASVASFAAGQCDFSFADPTPSNYCRLGNYCLSKAALIMFTYSLNRQLALTRNKVQVYVVHPGIVATRLYRSVPLSRLFSWINSWFFKSPLEGALSIIQLALAPPANRIDDNVPEPSVYFADGLPMHPYCQTLDKGRQNELWNRTSELLNLPKYICS